MPKKYSIICQLFLFFPNFLFSQFGFSHEIGVITGPVAFQSDYGQRNNFSTDAGNTGFGIGIIHYLNFCYNSEYNYYTRQTFFNDHFKLRSELSYNQTNLKHFGEWVRSSRNSLVTQQLRGMRGSTSVTNLGMQLEFFPLSIQDFSFEEVSLAPFISFGGQYSFYNPKASSILGALDTPITTPIKYYGATTNKSGTVWSLVGSLGTRYKLSPLSDIMLDFRMQYYFSNWVDGLSPDPTIYKENKANDWLIWLNFGYIYYLQ